MHERKTSCYTHTDIHTCMLTIGESSVFVVDHVPMGPSRFRLDLSFNNQKQMLAGAETFWDNKKIRLRRSFHGSWSSCKVLLNDVLTSGQIWKVKVSTAFLTRITQSHKNWTWTRKFLIFFWFFASVNKQSLGPVVGNECRLTPPPARGQS